MGYGKELNKSSKTSRPKMNSNNSQEIKTISVGNLKAAIALGLYPILKIEGTEQLEIEILEPIVGDNNKLVPVKILKRREGDKDS